MHLYIIRHATALPVTAPGVEGDNDRPLSDEGQAEIALLAQTFKKMGIAFDKLISSPLVRARQTAEGLMKALAIPDERLVVTEHLEPGGAGKKLAKLLRKLDGEHVAIVGHEPDLSRLTGWLMGSKRAQLDLAKAGVACLSCEEPPAKGAGCLLWLVSPALLGAVPVRS